MARSLVLAEKGLFTATPNPRVGCVLAKDGAIVGEGWHEKAGGPHAEVVALEQAGSRAAGTALYVTLEPCSHQGRTAPCVDLILKKGVKRVVAAMLDPNPQAAHGGVKLAAAGVIFEHGLMQEQATELNIGFVSRMTRGRPWVRLKIAATLDGRTALPDGRSQWITGPEARRDGHRWRARACAILTGIGTVKADDPRLTVREVPTPRQPLRIVVDSRLEVPDAAKVLEGESALIFCGSKKDRKMKAEVVELPNSEGKVDLPKMLQELGRRGVNELQVEAGFRLNGSLVHEGCVDEFLIYLNPSLLGDNAQGMVSLPGFSSLDERMMLKLVSMDRVGGDIRI
ncbi:MAG TPA: bifunctional diaminohydroxyphosphoribosylaminopyrimidine deaminase/5-amino-6-(5-phosphoribosylamino)uracil reductase RibD, partial [Burkholderiales bacterium]|nr:bifunctional diaminohydroxyphosphoribosylaminopyrimidine deaminase/5-amino-6-(5-phosphoribosylamino)uracil reductase RibD [Burkholderiales bacterium]